MKLWQFSAWKRTKVIVRVKGFFPYAIVAAFIGIVFVVVNKIDRTKNDMVMDMPFVYVGS